VSDVRLYHGDCLDILPTLPAASVDMILADPPYGTTACKWDSVIPFAPMWAAIERVIKPNGAVVLFGSQPFTSALVMSKPGWFRYCWVWEKNKTTGYLDANRKPLKAHEDIAVFYEGQPTYNPQMTRVKRAIYKHKANRAEHYNSHNAIVKDNGGKAYPPTIVYCEGEAFAVHPTQKPVALLAYLIRTYTNKGETVLDFCMGSGSTGAACIEEGRDFIGIEKDAEYFKVAAERIERERTKPRTLRMEMTV
jgi:DNA modification methylase